MIIYEAGRRHADTITNELGVQHAKSAPSPAVEADNGRERDASELVPGQSSAFRSIAVRANQLAMDRPNIQIACKEICASMAKPIQQDWGRL